MGLKFNNPNGEVVLASMPNLFKQFFLKNCQKCIQKWNLLLFFSRKCYNCPKNKIVHNFHITNPNGMNQSSPSL